MNKNKFPILLINSPSTKTSKVELPGDPVSILYATRDLFSSLRDNYFQSNIKPEIIQFDEQPIYDPRIWNDKTKQEFRGILNADNPLAIFFCTYSPSHPYALEMAREIKGYNKDSLVVFGGKHQDETLQYDSHYKRFNIGPCNTLKLISDGKIPQLVDLVVSGEGERPLRFVNEKIGKYLERKERFNSEDFKEYFLSQKQTVEELDGRSVIGLINGSEISLLHTNNKPHSLFDFGSPYSFFPIKTRNPIFLKEDGTSKLSTNLITTRGCKNRCIYCSESVLLNKGNAPSTGIVSNTLDRVIEDIKLGSESMFFDDSVFMRGNLEKILEFSSRLIGEKRIAASKISDENYSFIQKDSDNKFLKRLSEFEYAVQFCVEDIVKERNKEYVLETLKKLKESGCTYIYTGIESLDDQVMKNVQKFRQSQNNIYHNWFEKVDCALGLFQEAELKVGASLLFGIPGETYTTIDNTINRTKALLAENKLYLVSPNLCSYHPGTQLTKTDGVINNLDYVNIPTVEDPLMTFFEEASEGHLSKTLNREMVEYIRNRLGELKNLNLNTIKDTQDGKG